MQAAGSPIVQYRLLAGSRRCFWQTALPRQDADCLIERNRRRSMQVAMSASFVESTRRYERWLGKHLDLVPADLRLKHARMAEDVLPFLRATYYRWAEVWPELCPELARAPVLLAVGDLHVENFGTWRDREGRLVWGVNDFDEAYGLPYTNDLVRLATSAHLASDHLSLPCEEVCQAILDGYMAALEDGAAPFVLEEQHAWLRDAAAHTERDPVRFWDKLVGLEPAPRVPKRVRRLLDRAMPEEGLEAKIFHRVAGLGSLGRPRFVAIALWRGGMVAREAKALAPSACSFAAGKRTAPIHYRQIVRDAIRVPDPFACVREDWIVRRLSPSCGRIELASLPRKRDEHRLLAAMGFEAANIHLGARKARKLIRRDLQRRRPDWLLKAVRVMARAVEADWKAWRAYRA